MKQNWSQEFRDFLARTYQYDKETGYVTRRHEPIKGPRQRGSIGTVTPTRDLILVVMFQGKSHALRVARLAVFLETGLLYEKVIHKDGVRLNQKWDNLVPGGFAYDPDGNRVNEVDVEEKAKEFREKKKLMEDEAELKIIRAKETEEIELEKRLATKHVKKEPEPFVDYQANIAAFMEAGAARRRALQAEPYYIEYWAAYKKYQDKLATYRWRSGLRTGMSTYLLRMFAKDCEQIDGLSAVEFYKAN